VDKIYKPMTLKESHFSCSTTKIRGNPGIDQFIPEKISCGWFVFARYVPDKDQSVAPTRATASFGGHGAGLDDRGDGAGWMAARPTRGSWVLRPSRPGGGVQICRITGL
jgi:hypothetical protein